MNPGEARRKMALRFKARKERRDERAAIEAERVADREAVRAERKARIEAQRYALHVAKWQAKRLVSRRKRAIQRQRQTSVENRQTRIQYEKVMRTGVLPPLPY